MYSSCIQIHSSVSQLFFPLCAQVCSADVGMHSILPYHCDKKCVSLVQTIELWLNNGRLNNSMPGLNNNMLGLNNSMPTGVHGLNNSMPTGIMG
jgi:hypothetical protein